MVSTTAFRNNSFAILKLVRDSRDGSIVIKVHNKEKVYRVTLELTDEIFIPSRSKKIRVKMDKPKKVPLKMADCKQCHHFTLNGICSNKKCDSNTKPKPES